MSPISVFALVYLLAATALAYWRGHAWERSVAAWLCAAWAVSAVTPFDGVHPPWGAIAADAVVFLLLFYACLRSNRRWILFAAAFQFLILATHYVFASNAQLMQWAYVSAYYVWNIALITALGAGAIWSRKDALNSCRPPQQD